MVFKRFKSLKKEFTRRFPFWPLFLACLLELFNGKHFFYLMSQVLCISNTTMTFDALIFTIRAKGIHSKILLFSCNSLTLGRITIEDIAIWIVCC